MMNPNLSLINRALNSCGTRPADRIPAAAEADRGRVDGIHAQALKLVEQCMDRAAFGSYSVLSDKSVQSFWGNLACFFENIQIELQNCGPDSILLDDQLTMARSRCEDAAGNTETDDLFWNEAARTFDLLIKLNGPEAERALKEEKS